MKTYPLASTCQYTIGYDDAGIAGLWPGEMAYSSQEFHIAYPEAVFVEDRLWFILERPDESLVWVNSDGIAYPPEPLLRASGDR